MLDMLDYELLSLLIIYIVSELQPEVSQQPIPQKTVLRRAATPSTRPMMTRSGQARSQTLKRKKKNSVQG